MADGEHSKKAKGPFYREEEEGKRRLERLSEEINGQNRTSTPVPYATTTAPIFNSSNSNMISSSSSNNTLVSMVGTKRRPSQERFMDEDGESFDSRHILTHKKFITEVISSQLDSLQLSNSNSTESEDKRQRAIPVIVVKGPQDQHYWNQQQHNQESGTSATHHSLSDSPGTSSGSKNVALFQNQTYHNFSPLRQVISSNVSPGKFPHQSGKLAFLHSYTNNSSSSSSSSSSDEEDVGVAGEKSQSGASVANEWNFQSTPRRASASSASSSSSSSKMNNRKKSLGYQSGNSPLSSVSGGAGGMSNALIVSPKGGVGISSAKGLLNSKKLSPARLKTMHQLLKRYSSNLGKEGLEDDGGDEAPRNVYPIAEEEDEEMLEQPVIISPLKPVLFESSTSPIPESLLKSSAISDHQSGGTKDLVLYKPLAYHPRITKLINEGDESLTLKMSKGKVRSISVAAASSIGTSTSPNKGTFVANTNSASTSKSPLPQPKDDDPDDMMIE